MWDNGLCPATCCDKMVQTEIDIFLGWDWAEINIDWMMDRRVCVECGIN